MLLYVYKMLPILSQFAKPSKIVRLKTSTHFGNISEDDLKNSNFWHSELAENVVSIVQRLDVMD